MSPALSLTGGFRKVNPPPSAHCSQWWCGYDRLVPDVRGFQCAALKGVAYRRPTGLSVDSDYHVGGFDNRIGFGTGL
jgi:hypothetical protein